RVNVEGLFRMPTTSHAVVADGTVYVSGILGTVGSGLDLADGGVAGQTAQALRNVALVLDACGAALDDLVKVTVYLTDTAGFLDMEQAFGEVVTCGPARIVVYCPDLPLGAAAEVDAIAVLPTSRKGE
ncbi:MAG TPA: RidA family protein, partial [Acidimicrobiales bacterium]